MQPQLSAFELAKMDVDAVKSAVKQHAMQTGQILQSDFNPNIKAKQEQILQTLFNQQLSSFLQLI